MNPVHILTPYFVKIHFNITLPTTDLRSGLLPSVFPTKILYAFIASFRTPTFNAGLIIPVKLKAKWKFRMTVMLLF